MDDSKVMPPAQTTPSGEAATQQTLDTILHDLEKQYKQSPNASGASASSSTPTSTVPASGVQVKPTSTPPISLKETPVTPAKTPPISPKTGAPITPEATPKISPIAGSGLKAALGIQESTPMGQSAMPTPAPSTPVIEEQKQGLLQKIGTAKLAVGGGVMAIAVAGLVVVNVLVKQEQNITPQAFRGANVNAERILEKTREAPADPDRVLDHTNEAEVKATFQKLTEQYAGKGDTEIQSINEPTVRVGGTAYLRYEPLVKGTFVWSRVENLPAPNNQVVRVWITKDGVTYTNVGTVSFVKENGVLVAYHTFIHKDDLRTYQDLVWSYDEPEEKTQPQDIVLTVKF